MVPRDAPHETADYKIAELLRRLLALETWQADVEATGDADLDARTIMDRLEATYTALDVRANDAEDDVQQSSTDLGSVNARLTTAEADIDALQSATYSWNVITGKPSTFPPSDHGNLAHTPDLLTSVDWSIITDKPGLLPAETLNTQVNRFNSHTHGYVDENLEYQMEIGSLHSHTTSSENKNTGGPNN